MSANDNPHLGMSFDEWMKSGDVTITDEDVREYVRKDIEVRERRLQRERADTEAWRRRAISEALCPEQDWEDDADLAVHEAAVDEAFARVQETYFQLVNDDE